MKDKIAVISEEAFQTTLFVYLLLLIVETFKEGFVTDYFNPNYLLGIILCSGIIMIFTKNEEKVVSKGSKMDIWYTAALAVGGGIFICFKTIELGIISFIIAFLSSFLIGLLSYLIYTDKDTN